MDITAITTIISNVGFPIAACIAMFWYVNKQTDVHKQEIDKLTESLNNNTKALNKLVDALGGGEEDESRD